jgi:hypothetical protein
MEDKNNKIYKVNSESILREEPSLFSKFITILLPNTQFQIIEESSLEKKDEKYSKIKIIKNNIYPQEYQGWILYNQIKEYKPSLSLETKNKLLTKINEYLNLKTAYSMEFPQRNGGFFDKLYDEKYYFDCSSFVTTILNRIFKFPPPNPESSEIIVWATMHYFENIQKENSLFDIIQKIDKPGEKLDLNNLEIGDIILGRAKKLTDGINHILFYVGEGYIVHCTRGNFLGKKENEYRNGVVKEKMTANYYTEIETPENIEKGNITKRFDDKIYVIRYKENNDVKE